MRRLKTIKISDDQRLTHKHGRTVERWEENKNELVAATAAVLFAYLSKRVETVVKKSREDDIEGGIEEERRVGVTAIGTKIRLYSIQPLTRFVCLLFYLIWLQLYSSPIWFGSSVPIKVRHRWRTPRLCRYDRRQPSRRETWRYYLHDQSNQKGVGKHGSSLKKPKRLELSFSHAFLFITISAAVARIRWWRHGGPYVTTTLC